MIDDEEQSDVQKALHRQARIEARLFARVFRTAEGKIVLDALKRDFGWDAATPVPDKQGEISAARLRAWTGSRAVIATIQHKISLGESLGENPNQTNNDES